jgi:surfeit locus 1 family protein
MFIFRPYPWLSVFTLLGLALAVWLGVWQVERAAWKRDLITTYEAERAQPPVGLTEALCQNQAERRIAGIDLSAFDAAPVIALYGFDTEGRPGWRQLALISADPCGQGGPSRLIETGFLALDGSRSVPETWILSMIAPKTLFSAPNDPDRNEWYAFDAPAMAGALGARDLAPEVLLASGEQMPAGLSAVAPARHYGYAATWFGLGLTLLIIYGVFHHRAGRLGWTRKG